MLGKKGERITRAKEIRGKTLFQLRHHKTTVYLSDVRDL